MSFDFLSPIATYPDPTPKDALRRALNLAAKMTGRVTAVIHEVDVAPVHSVLADLAIDVTRMSAAAEARSNARGSEMESWLDARTERLHLPLTLRRIRCRPEMIADRLVQASRVHDFALLAIDSQSQPQREFVESIIFGSGGPVLIVAAQETAMPLADAAATPMSVIVAWDGSRLSARALRDAMPVLALASKVSIVTVGDDKPIDAASLSGVCQFLKHHGIEPRHIERSKGSSPIGEVLQAVALAEGADLLVMGAYGHTRLQEFILGGATRTVLDNARLPILLSH